MAKNKSIPAEYVVGKSGGKREPTKDRPNPGCGILARFPVLAGDTAADE
jgi:hypothetical protein